MAEDLDRERLEMEKQKIADDLKLEQRRLSLEEARLAREDHVLNRNLGVLITAATTVLGICITAGQLGLATIQKNKEIAQKVREEAFLEQQKALEFDFQESRDLREFVTKNIDQIISPNTAARASMKVLMLTTYRPEIVASVLDGLSVASPEGQRITWIEAKKEANGIAKILPDQAWCYQEKKGSGKFGVYWHRSENNCNIAKQGSRTAGGCILVSDLPKAGWAPHGGGFMGSWYEEGYENPKPAPFPQPSSQ